MKLKLLIALYSIMLFSPLKSMIPDSFYTDFHQSMACNPQYNITKEKNNTLYKTAETLYNNYLNNITWHENPTIPCAIHHIWLGSSLPHKQRILFDTWHTYNPTWVHVLWTDKDSNHALGSKVVHSYKELIEVLASGEYKGKIVIVDIRSIELENQGLFNKATNYGEKSDILRYELLYNIGGLYVDTDFECIRSFELFHHTCQFFTTMYTKNQIQNGLIASAAHHPLLKFCINKLKSANPRANTFTKTGPIFLARSIFEYLKNNMENSNEIVLFPVTYFYPWPHCARLEKKEEIDKWIRPETYAIHHWHCSWM